MPKVFLSYSRSDLRRVAGIQKALEEHAFQVWRDEDRIRGGDAWPKVLGEAISGCDRVVLVWSRAASRSPRVQEEWNAALALQVPVVPYRLDGTPLHPSLAALHAVDDVSALLRSFEVDTSGAYLERVARERRGRALRSALAASLVVVASVAGWQVATAPPPYVLGGTILDERGEPVPGVVVQLSDREGVRPDTTDMVGRFHLEVPGDSPPRVSLIATKQGYATHRSDPVLPNPNFQIVLDRTP